MRKTGIIVLIIIGGVIAAYVGLQTNSANIAPSITDSPEITDEVKMDSEEALTEEVSKINDEGFYIDENGVKHYVISAVDSPKLGD